MRKKLQKRRLTSEAGLYASQDHYVALVAAILDRARRDAKGQIDLSRTPHPGVVLALIHEARKWLENPHNVAYWCDLVGAEWEPVWHALRQDVAVEEGGHNDH